MTVRFAEAEIVRLVDADTVHTNLDIGWGIILRPRMGKAHNFGTLRICHTHGEPYDAPEKNTDAGKRAIEFIGWHIAPGEIREITSFGLATDGRRTLASVRLRNGMDWAALMVEAGFVK